jgi:hypothetical protein
MRRLHEVIRLGPRCGCGYGWRASPGHAANRQCPLGQVPAPVPRPGAPVTLQRHSPCIALRFLPPPASRRITSSCRALAISMLCCFPGTTPSVTSRCAVRNLGSQEPSPTGILPIAYDMSTPWSPLGSARLPPRKFTVCSQCSIFFHATNGSIARVMFLSRALVMCTHTVVTQCCVTSFLTPSLDFQSPR